MSKAIELSGKKLGRWLVISRNKDPQHKGVGTYWNCVCDCGCKKAVDGSDLREGKSTSCGCFKLEMRIKHGNAITGKMSHEYRCWIAIRSRCNSEANDHYADYGGRGIRVCERWNSFENFLADMGLKPSPKHSIGRKDNNGNYEPSNCRWETMSQQNRNRRGNRLITFRGETMIITDWAIRFNLTSVTIHYRIKRGWSIEDALTKPLGFRVR